MSSNVQRAFTAVKPHIPLIKFRKGGLDKIAGSSISNSSMLSHNDYSHHANAIDESQLPSKFQRKPLEDQEIDIIMRGGPDL